MSTIATAGESHPLSAPGPDPVVVFDIGGSYLRRARWDSRHGVRDREDLPSPSFRRHPGEDAASLRERLVSLLDASTPPGAVAGISLGAALDHRSGVVYASAPLWGEHTEPFDLAARLRERRPDVRWHIVNDVTAALLHYASAPERRPLGKLMLVTVSTGIACRMLDRTAPEPVPVDGSGLQGEMGHLPATATLAGQPVELTCDCGVPGHVAAYSSGPGLRRLAEELSRRSPGDWSRSRMAGSLTEGASFEAAFAAALDAGDALGRELLSAATGPVADVLRTALCLCPALDEVALTGGLAVSLGEHYRAAILSHLSRQGLYLTQEMTPGWTAERITVCPPGAADGLAGAGLAATGAASTGAAS